MDHGACNIIYLDRRAQEELISRDSIGLSTSIVRSSETQGYFNSDGSALEVQSTIEAILSIFNEVHVFRSGASCLGKVIELQNNNFDKIPTILLIDIPYDEEQRLKRLSREPRTPSPTSTRSLRRITTESIEPDDIYGVHLLKHISAEIQSNNLSKLVVPVVVLSGFERDWASTTLPSPSLHGSQVLTDTVRLVRYLDYGAVDVLTSPLSKDQVHCLAVHAYRVYKEVTREQSCFLPVKRARKTSWVGVEEAKPYAYLREAMVSSLMNGIINPETVTELMDLSDVQIEPERQAVVRKAVGSWSFSAHDFSDDELVHACLVMLEHALKMPELAKWRMPTDELTRFLLGCRAAYNSFVLYHNFRHVADVLQAVFYFLVQIGTLLPVRESATSEPQPRSAIATLIKPFDALTLLISAIGHDVGHPGVNNAFLVALNAPLAQLYNDRSVLESFHCAAYSQILRRYWPVVFQDCSMRKLMINSILATDMGLHFKYMADLGNLQEKLAHNNRTLDGWNLKQLEEYRDLTCGLLIKCADISNVARKYDVAAQWASILTDEFLRQGDMEKELEMQSCLFGGSPVKDDIIKMGESQIGFMNIFAKPLFEGVTDILPAMKFSVDEIDNNKAIWQDKIEREKFRLTRGPNGRHLLHADLDVLPSPMSKSEVDLSFPGGPNSLPNSEPLAPAPTRRSPSSSARSSGTHDCSTPRYGGAVEPVDYAPAQNLTHSRRGSGGDNASLTAIIVTQTPSPPSDRKRGEKGHAGCSPRLRSLSPAKRKQRAGKEKGDSGRKEGGLLGRRYASHSDLSGNGDGTRHYPSAHSQSDIPRVGDNSHGLPNGTTNMEVNSKRPHTGNGQAEKTEYLASVLSGSSTDPSSGKTDDSQGKKSGRFTRFWKKRWRSTRDDVGPPLCKESVKEDFPPAS